MKDSDLNGTLQTPPTQEMIYELRVQQAMTRHVITVAPEETMEDVSRVLEENRHTGMPVIKWQKMVGIVSVRDLMRCFREGRSLQPVSQWMSKDVATLYADEPLIHAVQKFERRGFGRFPVIDRKTKALVGILTKVDIIRCLLRNLEIDYHDLESRQYIPTKWFSELDCDRTTLSFRYHIDGANFEKAGEVSSKLKHNLQALGLPPDAIRRIAIASFEAEVNLVIYTKGGELAARVEPGKVTVSVVDDGPGIPDVERAMQPGYSTAPDWVRELGFGAGMGLPNIKNCTNEMKLESKVGEGTNLQFTVFT